MYMLLVCVCVHVCVSVISTHIPLFLHDSLRFCPSSSIHNCMNQLIQALRQASDLLDPRKMQCSTDLGFVQGEIGDCYDVMLECFVDGSKWYCHMCIYIYINLDIYQPLIVKHPATMCPIDGFWETPPACKTLEDLTSQDL